MFNIGANFLSYNYDNDQFGGMSGNLPDSESGSY